MTDNEIKQALPFLAKYCKNEYNDIRVDEVLLGASDLINRQKAEIAKYNAELKEVAKRADEWHREAKLNAAEIIKLQAEKEGLINGQISLQKALAQKDAEIQRSSNFVSEERCREIAKEMFPPIIRQARSDALKELMFNLDNDISIYTSAGYGIDIHAWLKNYVKEMVGDTE
jgi:hypothetical protein